MFIAVSVYGVVEIVTNDETVIVTPLDDGLVNVTPVIGLIDHVRAPVPEAVCDTENDPPDVNDFAPGFVNTGAVNTFPISCLPPTSRSSTFLYSVKQSHGSAVCDSYDVVCHGVDPDLT